MKFSEYSPLALRTAKPLSHAQQVQHALIGLITEVGELADCIKKHAIYGKPLDKVNLMEEVGDCFWYLNLYLEESKDTFALDVDKLSASAPADAGWLLVRRALDLGAMAGTLALPESARDVPSGGIAHALALTLLYFLEPAEVDLSETLTRNIDKLALRYGDKYADYKALNRDTSSERIVLEGAPGG